MKSASRSVMPSITTYPAVPTAMTRPRHASASRKRRPAVIVAVRRRLSVRAAGLQIHRPHVEAVRELAEPLGLVDPLADRDRRAARAERRRDVAAPREDVARDDRKRVRVER